MKTKHQALLLLILVSILGLKTTPEINSVKTYLRSFMPTENAENVASKMRDKSPTGENVTDKEPDLTIKPKRVLSQLK